MVPTSSDKTSWAVKHGAASAVNSPVARTWKSLRKSQKFSPRERVPSPWGDGRQLDPRWRCLHGAHKCRSMLRTRDRFMLRQLYLNLN